MGEKEKVRETYIDREKRRKKDFRERRTCVCERNKEIKKERKRYRGIEREEGRHKERQR